MWCRFGVTMTAVTLGVVTSFVSYEIALAARTRDYTPRQFRAVLRGFGYDVTEGNTLTDPATVKAIREFQQGYKLTVDGTANAQTQDGAAQQVKNLQGNLNLVVKPNPPLPRTQYYGPQTTAAVRLYQQKAGLPVTGIATLPIRQKIDQEARDILNQQSPAPTSSPTPSPSPSPSASPSIRRRSTLPRTAPSPAPSSTPTTSPSLSPSTSPSPSQSP